MPEFFKEKELYKEKSAPTVAELDVGDVIMYEGKRREVEKISEKSISLKDLDAPDYGGILLGTSDVFSYEGWQADMSDAADISDTSSPANDVPAVTLKYKGDAESLDEIKTRHFPSVRLLPRTLLCVLGSFLFSNRFRDVQKNTNFFMF